MALIKGFEQSTKDRNSVHRQAKAHYTVFDGPDGKRYFQIDTFGSADRQMPGKVSQAIQLDRESARTLVDLLQREFSR
jgi:hypothetical protein